ncbi:coronin-1A-like isoform X3 [Babylonia areolata]|uniref:coronin-1A-like isoform X3 n=1 Tax=Babylonia areolata TaxID=304850 RepID=UPI003FD48DF6
MPMAFKIRSSKFRHVYGSPFRKEQWYENVRITRNAHDSNFCAVNPSFLAVVTESAGGGAFLVLPLERTGRVDLSGPKVSGHSGAVLDIKWNPFNDHMIASSSEDCTVKLWQIPNSGLVTPKTDWWVDLHGHSRRVGFLEWHPTAQNIILSAGFDYKCIVWNVEQAEPVNMIDCHTDTIFSISWSRDGALFATTSKDKQLRTIDPRTGQVAAETQCHAGPKASKVVFVDNVKVATTGFSRMSQRQMSLWDLRNSKTALDTADLDQSCGVILPYYDYDTRVIFLAGKGDGTIKYFEVSDTDSCFHYLNAYQSSSPQRGLGVMPKRGCDARRCEIVRFYKLHAAKNLVEPISMIVPRKSDCFQEDVFPPTASTIPSLQADEWISGQNREPILVSVLDGSVANSPQITTSKAVQKQDGPLQHPPTITTYRAVDRRQREPPGGRAQQNDAGVRYRRHEPSATSEPASLKNIKRLSLNEDIVVIPSSVNAEEKKITPPGAEPSTNGVSASDSEHSPSRQSPSVLQSVHSRRQAFTASSKPNSESVSTGRTRRPVTRSLTIGSGSPSSSSAAAHNSCMKVTLGETESPTSNTIHIRKTWHPPPPQLSPQTVSHSQAASPPLPDSVPELKKAYFRQVEEISSLKEQLSLKDKRIRQLETELSMLRHNQGSPASTEPGSESHC